MNKDNTKQLDRRVDDLTGRLLAWTGGFAVLVGLVFLLAIGVSSGWLDEGMRAGLAAIGSLALVLAGVWLQERRSRGDAAVATTAAGIAGLFVTVTVATQVYDLIPTLAGVVLAALVGAVSTTLAVRWKSRGFAALGIVGGLAAPILGGAELDGGSMAILFVTLAAASGVVLWQRWSWLAPAAFAVSAPQWCVYVLDGPGLSATFLTAGAFGALGAVLAVGYQVRRGSEEIPIESAFLLALNAIVVAAVGWAGFDAVSEPAFAKAWLVAVAVAHIAFGLAGPRRQGVSRDLGLLSLAIGVLVADVALALIADGLALTIGWAATGVGFAALMRHTKRDSHQEALIGGGLGGHLALALVVSLFAGDSWDGFGNRLDVTDVSAAGIAALAAACLTSARLAGDRRAGGAFAWKPVLDAAGLAAVALTTALTFQGEALALAWLGEAVVLGAIAWRTRDMQAAFGGLGFLGLAAVHGPVYELPPSSLVTGIAHPLAALAVVGGVATAALLGGRKLADLDPYLRPVLYGAGALALLYLGSGLVVTPFESGEAVESTLLDAHQQGQMVLSVFWALVGVGALAIGLVRDLRTVRLAALALLGVAVAKVFLLDLASLTSVYRVVSLIALGVLLLIGALVWQRLRPRRLPDLREAPGGVS